MTKIVKHGIVDRVCCVKEEKFMESKEECRKMNGVFFQRKLDHINITVPDLEKGVEFYTKVLGFQEIQRFMNREKVFVFLTDGNVTYELMERDDVPQGTFDHVAYSSTDLQADYDYFMKTDPSLLMGEIGFAAGLFEHGMYYFFVQGSNGERVEFCQRKTQ